MNCAIMGNLDGNLVRVCFDLSSIKQILHLDTADLVLSHDGDNLFLKVGDDVCKVENNTNGGEIGPYFIVLNSSKAFSVKDYQILFNIRELPDNLLSGTDVGGKQHLCKRYGMNGDGNSEEACSIEKLSEKLENGSISEKEIESLREMVKKLRKGEFYEALTNELSGKIKEIATELIEFRKDLQKKIEPNIVDLARNEIPEASNQLEGINETLEKSTMKIMDINEELLDLSNFHMESLESYLNSGEAEVENNGDDGSTEGLEEVVNEMKEFLTNLSGEYSELAELLLPTIEKAASHLSEGGEASEVRDIVKVAIDNIQLLTSEETDSDVIENLDKLGKRLAQAIESTQKNSENDPMAVLKKQIDGFRKINKLCMNMLEPLSFQDLVGQRIQRIIKLVESMEKRIEDLVVSFGVKLQKHKEAPDLSYEEVSEEVEEFTSELKGPQREGEGLDQAAIDDLLASL